ncbi:hypothetical protein T265_08623 [Opisthorchis viverrini]|uniref:Peptidase C2 calpain domain-containing protein n=1 Tax=Opisthorchis viverrini TaxID=6198 RepID=A0A074Z8F9_OPIVI|nr:hypothetical protein T265_08623 [Opisthorchis viverrini]KER23501.1 hypothetical protein T265_08623 [Opisthorchis viverrini]
MDAQVGQLSAEAVRFGVNAPRTANGDLLLQLCADPQSYATNPQFQFDVPENENEDHELVVISLLLCDFRKRSPPKIRQIGFRIYSLTQPHNSPLSAVELTSLPTVYNTECQSRATVTVLLQLIQGSYLIVPSTEEPNQRGDFKIRLVSLFKASIWELDRPNKQLEISAEQEMMTPSVVQSDHNIRTCIRKFDRHCDKESFTLDAAQLRKLFRENHPKGKFKVFKFPLVEILSYMFVCKHLATRGIIFCTLEVDQ